MFGMNEMLATKENKRRQKGERRRQTTEGAESRKCNAVLPMSEEKLYSSANRWKTSVETETPQPQDKPDVVLDLNFVPTWARQPAGQNPYAHFEDRGERRERRDRGGDDRGRRREGPGRRPPDRRGREFGRPPGDKGQGGQRDRRGRPGDRPDHQPERSRRGPEMERREEQPFVEISFVPERTRLGALVNDIRNSGRAYPLAEMAGRFLTNPAFYLVKVESCSPHHSPKSTHFYQCKECKDLFLDRPRLVEHAKARHMELKFVREVLESEAPAGNFVVVARCRLTGDLLGPPNYHGYNEKLVELWRTRFPHMSLDEYRSQIETVRDADLIEKWKQEARTQTVYKVKGQENAPAMKPGEAEKYFETHFAGSFVADTSRCIVPADVATRFEDQALRRAVRDAWTRESHRPFSLMLALRPAFHHMRLNLFKVGNGMTFVTPIQPHPLPGNAIQPIAEVLQFLRDHPGCTRQELVDKLRPGAAPDSREVAAVISPLRWIIEKGHVIEFFDGTLSVPASRSAAGTHPGTSRAADANKPPATEVSDAPGR